MFLRASRSGFVHSARTIAFSTNRHGSSDFEIYTMTSPGGSQTCHTDQAGHDVASAWSADGEKLVFATSRTQGSGSDFNLFTMAKNRTNQQPLVVRAAMDIFPDW
ncbi:MAG: PD40 domain-containing protein [Actinobacteria bacterium]|nr:PD40 domain-containing protein [Actinomycetota bacterium]